MLRPKGGRMAKLDLTVGQTATRSNTITQAHVDAYADMTGDRNPLHFDDDYVAKTPFGRRVVHGGLTSGILNALVAEDMPGPGTVFMSMELSFLKPVFVGDTITATAEVLEVHPSKPVCKLSVKIEREDGEVVLTGTTGCYRMLPRED
jgi:acyl dehydratase